MKRKKIFLKLVKKLKLKIYKIKNLIKKNY